MGLSYTLGFYDDTSGDPLDFFGFDIRFRLFEWRDRVRDLATHPGFRRPVELLRQSGQQFDDLTARLGQSLGQRLVRARQRFAYAQTRIQSVDLRAKIRALHERLERRSAELGVRIERSLAARRQRVERLLVQLDERSPLRVLERGYAIVTDAAGNVVRAADQVALGDTLAIQLAKGRLAAEVKRKDEK